MEMLSIPFLLLFLQSHDSNLKYVMFCKGKNNYFLFQQGTTFLGQEPIYFLVCTQWPLQY